MMYVSLCLVFLGTISALFTAGMHKYANNEVRKEYLRSYVVAKIKRHFTETENRYLKREEHILNLFAELESKYYTHVKELKSRLTEMEQVNAVLITRVKEAENLHAKDVSELSTRLTNLENLCSHGPQPVKKTLRKVPGYSRNSQQGIAGKETVIIKTQESDISTDRHNCADFHNTNKCHNAGNRSKIHPDKGIHVQRKHSKEFRNTRHQSRAKLQKRVGPTDGVVFHAQLSSSLTNPGIGHIIPFQTVLTNMGGHFHPNTGVFTCQLPGVYVFAWSIQVGGASQAVDTHLIKNGVTIGYSTAGDADHDTWGHGTAVVAVQLEQGDEVWVKIDAILYGTHIASKLTMFTGFLLRF